MKTTIRKRISPLSCCGGSAASNGDFENVVTLGGIFILLIVSCDDLADMGWFGPDIQSFARR